MGLILLLSITIRLVACGLTLHHFARTRHASVLFFTAMTALMATRQALSYIQLEVPLLGGPWPTELPGLVVSFLVLAAVVFYARALNHQRDYFCFSSDAPSETGYAMLNASPRGRVLSATHNLGALVGMPARQLAGRPLDALFEPTFPQDRFLEGLERARSEGSARMEAQLTDPRGEPIPVRVFVRPQSSLLLGRLSHFTVVLVDLRPEEKARNLQEAIADLARDAEDIIANEGWGLMHIAECAAQSLGVQRVNIWWFSPDRRYLRCAESFDARSGQHVAGSVLDLSDHPDYAAALESARVIDVADTADDPRTLEFYDSYLRPNGIGALLDAPIRVEGQVAGVLCLEQVGAPRAWDNMEVAFAGSLGDLVALARTAALHRAREEQLHRQSYLDPLTGLFNWQYLQEQLERDAAAQGAGEADGLALLYIDVDQFRYINDALGHVTGDRLLLEVAQELMEVQPPGSLLGRVGGDEFVLILRGVDAETATAEAERIRAQLTDYRFTAGEQDFTISTSIGVAELDKETGSAGELLAHADLACSMAKEAGRNQVAVYRPQDAPQQQLSDRLAMFNRVRAALDAGRFQLVFQPIRGLLDQGEDFHEVLLRMREDGGLLSPAEFMPTAERFGLMGEIDRWVVHEALTQLARWRRQRPNMALSINLSARAFSDAALFSEVRQHLDELALDPEAVMFEITETEAIANLAEAQQLIWRLKELGCRFALDDFGSGFASFTYLRDLPTDLVKIDGKFVRELPHSSLDRAIVHALVDIAHTLGKQVVAEFVDSGKTLAALRMMGVEYGQGFYLGRPDTEPAPPDPAEADPPRQASGKH